MLNSGVGTPRPINAEGPPGPLDSLLQFISVEQGLHRLAHQVRLRDIAGCGEMAQPLRLFPDNGDLSPDHLRKSYRHMTS